jgi:hypothetical protein
MAPEDINAILIYGGGGALFGAVTAIVFCRSKHPFIGTAVYSLFGAPLFALVIVGFFGAVESIRQVGFNPALAIAAAISTALFLSIGLLIFCGAPSLIAGFATQCVIQLLSRMGSRSKVNRSTDNRP